jgi:molybdopterin converting factor small subunit
VVQIVVLSILAAQAEGRQRFDVEAETVGEALRALPVADLLFNERGEWNAFLNVYVDGTDARERGSPARPLTGAREIRILASLSDG